MKLHLPLLPPVIDQHIVRVPPDAFAAVGFLFVFVVAVYFGRRRMPLGLALLAFFVPFAFYRDVGNTTITMEKCIAVGTAVGLLWSGAPLWPRSRAGRRVLLAGCGILLATILSGVHASYEWAVVREAGKQCEYLLLFWCAATFVETSERAQAYLVQAIAGSALLVSLVAVFQGIVGGAPSGIWMNGHPLPRAAGTIEGPNQLAGYLESALPVLWVLPALTSQWPVLKRWSVAPATAAMVLTLSRAGVVVAAACFALFARLRPALARKSVAPALVGLAVGVAGIYGWAVFWAHASPSDLAHLAYFDIPGNPGGVGTRSQLWPAAVQLFLSHPIYGGGAGNFQLLLPRLGLAGVQTNAGSLWLQTLAEQGIIGIIALSVFAYVSLRETFRLSAKSLVALAAFLAIGSLLTHQLADDLFFFPKVGGLCWLLLGAGSCQHLAEVAPPVTDGKGRETWFGPAIVRKMRVDVAAPRQN